ncbi:MAG TPA: hypothetical protein VNA29_08495 [Sphingomicrobium sp.]|nr:hypothetical protein [Sphingomicrobium sp.]
MIMTFITLALLASVSWLLLDTAKTSAGKIIAALQGNSLLAQPSLRKPVTARFSPRYAAPRPVRARIELRAAA